MGHMALFGVAVVAAAVGAGADDGAPRVARNVAPTTVIVGFEGTTDAGTFREAAFDLTEASLLFGREVVMARDEAPYVEALARAVSRPGARVLEVGYGMGISARAVLAARPAQYVVLEPNGGVFAAALDAAAAAGAVTAASPWRGFWQELTPLLRAGASAAASARALARVAPPDRRSNRRAVAGSTASSTTRSPRSRTRRSSPRRGAAKGKDEALALQLEARDHDG